MAVILGGSHARGEAVWAELPGRRVCLSDLDLHVLLADPSARQAAERAAAAGRAGMVAKLRGLGLAGPLELGFHTLSEWTRMPARPATLELRRCGLVLAGEREWRERLPAWRPRDIPPEEIRLLIENRAFELIAARFGGSEGDEALQALRAAHAQYKVALDLAGVERLASGAYEDTAVARVQAARAARAELARDGRIPTAGAGPSEAADEPAWSAALAWLGGHVPAAHERESDWWNIARAWVRAWSLAVAPATVPADFEAAARGAARRARLRRRVRMALRPEMRRGLAPPLAGRIGHAFAGTPQHRLNASAGAFLAAQSSARDSPESREAIAARLERVLGRLGAVRPGGDDAATAAALLETWDRWVMGGPRGMERP
ncbi:MAG: hypothetical protein ABIS67_12285 [Candidatus Eisenbacteria bacterium]